MVEMETYLIRQRSETFFKRLGQGVRDLGDCENPEYSNPMISVPDTPEYYFDILNYSSQGN